MIHPRLPTGWRGALGRAVFRAVPANLVLRAQASGNRWFSDLRKRAVARMHVPEGFSLAHAKSLPAVKAAVGEIAWRVACLPLRIYDAGSDEPVARTDPEARVLAGKWSSHTTAKSGIAQFARHVLLHGIGGAVVRREGMRVVEIQTANPNGLSRQLVSGVRLYHYQVPGGARVRIERDDLFFLAFEEPDDGVSDESPLEECWPAIRGAVAATAFSGWYYDRAAQPASVWQAPEGVSPKKLKDTMLRIWSMEDKMRDAGRRSLPAPAGWEHVQVGASAEDAAASDERTFGVQEVARIYHIPPSLLQDLTRGTYSNYTQQRHALGETVKRWAERIGDEFSNVMWPDGRRECRFDVAHTSRGPMQERMRGYRTGVEGGILTPNECREIEGRERSSDPGADECRRSDAPIIMLGTEEARRYVSRHEAHRTNGDGRQDRHEPAEDPDGSSVGAPFVR